VNKEKANTQVDIKKFQQALLAWYKKNQRSLPWREDKNPYYIWVSEIMAQQTRLETVIPYYERFIKKFPSIEALANAKDEELLKLWEGLGYYSRARNMKIAANQVMEDFNGRFPETLTAIKSLKGIGDYSASAIASICFGLPEPAIDGNLLRVTSRLLELDVDISKSGSKKVFEESLRELIDPTQPGDFNQAFMDIGSQICTPKVVKCELCPIRSFCRSHKNGTMLEFPVKTKKIKQQPLYYLAFAIRNEKNEFFIKKRTSEGLLSQMWMFPLKKVTKEEYDEVAKKKEFGSCRLSKKEITHDFSHQKWHILLLEGNVRELEKEESSILEWNVISKACSENQEWLSFEALEKLPLAGPQKKMMY